MTTSYTKIPTYVYLSCLMLEDTRIKTPSPLLALAWGYPDMIFHLSTFPQASACSIRHRVFLTGSNNMCGLS